MNGTADIIISATVEGPVDEAVVRRLIAVEGASLARTYGKKGKSHIRKVLQGYNQAARFSPWVVLVDLDRDADCAPPLRAEWLPTPSSLMCFRIAVREVEAWLLGDRERIAEFLSVAQSKIPVDPESLDDPKCVVVDLARHSRRSAIRDDLVPRPGSGRLVGPAYTSRIIEFAHTLWRPEVAALRTDSLDRCRHRIRELVERARQVPTTGPWE